MHIGVVSKIEHVKVHTKALREEGFEVTVLGSSPTRIPPTIELLVLRTQSCSHGGSHTAFSWARQNNKPLIVENGLTGLMKKVQLYKKLNIPVQALVAEAHKFLDGISEVVLEAPAPTEVVLEAPEAFVEVSEKIEKEEKKMLKKGFTPPTDNPTGRWVLTIPPKRVISAFESAYQIYQGMGDSEIKSVRANFFQEGTLADPKGIASTPGTDKLYALQGKPILFFILLRMIFHGFAPLNEKYLRDLYFSWFKKGTTKDTLSSTEWVVQEISEQVIQTPPPEPNLPQEQVLQNPPPEQTPPQTQNLSSPEFQDFRKNMEDLTLESVSTAGETLKNIHLLSNIVREFMESFSARNKELRGEIDSLRCETLESKEEAISLREEVSALREEISLLRAASGKKSEEGDPMEAISALRKRGASVTINFGSM